MKQRCFNPKNPGYKDYGKRGISVCDRWKNSFENFLEDMGECAENLSLDRIDNNGNYEPSNCRWANITTQLNNTRLNHHISINGKQYTIAQGARLAGIKYQTFYNRVTRGNISLEEAINKPVEIHRERCKK